MSKQSFYRLENFEKRVSNKILLGENTDKCQYKRFIQFFAIN